MSQLWDKLLDIVMGSYLFYTRPSSNCVSKNINRFRNTLLFYVKMPVKFVCLSRNMSLMKWVHFCFGWGCHSGTSQIKNEVRPLIAAGLDMFYTANPVCLSIIWIHRSVTAFSFRSPSVCIPTCRRNWRWKGNTKVSRKGLARCSFYSWDWVGEWP